MHSPPRRCDDAPSYGQDSPQSRQELALQDKSQSLLRPPQFHRRRKQMQPSLVFSCVPRQKVAFPLRK